jgi:hypothetical protein
MLSLIERCPDYRGQNEYIEMTNLGLNFGVLNREVSSGERWLLVEVPLYTGRLTKMPQHRQQGPWTWSPGFLLGKL